MYNSNLPRNIAELINRKDWKALSQHKDSWPEVETSAPGLVDILLSLEKTDRVLFFRALPRYHATEVFASLSGETRDRVLEQLSDHETQQLIMHLSPDDRTAFLSELPGEVTQRLLNYLSPNELKEARELLGYPDESVGRLMTPDYLAVRPDWSIQQALEHIRSKGHESETANEIYVVDDHWRLLDALALQKFVMADPSSQVKDIMDRQFESLRATEDRENAVRQMRRYNRIALPVVDSSGILIGIVTVDDVLDVAEQEATEDFHLSSAIQPLKSSYWDTSKFLLYRSRIGWLAVLVIINLVSPGVIAAYEDTLAAFVALAFFIPLIIDTGGNTGAQSATLMIRAISVGDIRLSDWSRVFLRELLIGIAIGVTLGLMGMVLGFFRGGPEIGIIVLL